MSLQIIGGKAVFKFDLGSGAATITNEKVVNDGVWHEAIMERLVVLNVKSSVDRTFQFDVFVHMKYLAWSHRKT